MPLTVDHRKGSMKTAVMGCQHPSALPTSGAARSHVQRHSELANMGIMDGCGLIPELKLASAACGPGSRV
jgi:hypothetical protein